MIFILVILGFSNQNYLLSQNKIFLQKSKLVKDNKYFYDEIFTSSYSVDSTTIGVYRCIFRSLGRETSSGGAVHIKLKNKCQEPLIFDSCLFENCIGSSGGALYIDSIDTNSNDYNLIFNNCTFNNNIGTFIRGSAICIYRTENVNIENCIFFNNSINSKEDTIDGGTIFFMYTYQINIENCNFQGNSIKHTNFYNRYDEMHIPPDEDHFFDYSYNLKLSSSSICFVSTNGNITNTKFNCEFVNTYSSLIDLNCTDIELSGGSIYCQDSNITFSDCSFKNTSVKSSENYKSDIDFQGGVLNCFKGYFLFFNCSFENNRIISPSKVKKSEIYGSCFYSFYCDKITFSDCSFKSNGIILNDGTFCEDKSKNYGGAIYVYSCKQNTFLNNCSFVNNFIESKLNSASCFGGGFCLNSANAHITDCTFSGNFIRGGSENSGGALASVNYNVNINLTNCIFVKNSASSLNIDSGGALYIMSGEVNNCTFIDNDAKFGGDLYFFQFNDLSNLSVNYCLFNRTKNLNVKSIFFFEQKKAKNLCKFENNKILIVDPKEIKIFNGTISNTKQMTFMFENNLVSNCNDQLFKDINFNMYDSSNKTITIYDAFQNCLSVSTEENTNIESDTQTELITDTYSYSNNDHFYSESEIISSSESENEPFFPITEVIFFTQSNDETNSYSDVFNQNTEKDKSSKKRNKIKKVVLILILVFEAVVISLIVALIILVAKFTKNMNQDEPLLND